MDAAQARVATPPPVIGKAGRYTVFLTPPATPKLPETPEARTTEPTPNPSSTPRNAAPLSPKAAPLHPVQVPPKQFEMTSARARSSVSVLGFVRDAVAKVQDVHSSLDEYLADWFGLNQSKYQWALNDYYENNGMSSVNHVNCLMKLTCIQDKEGGKQKELVRKEQIV